MTVDAIILNGIFVCPGHSTWWGHAEQPGIKKPVEKEGRGGRDEGTLSFSVCLELSDQKPTNET